MQKYKILKDVLDFAKNQLYKYDIENPSLDIALLASEAFGLSKIQLITKEYVSFEALHISDDAIQKFLYCIDLRCKNHSIAEILGIKNFYGLDFIVTNDVLTPRPETEILVEHFAQYVLDYVKNIKNNTALIKIIDIGTGSGCIAVTLAKILEKKLSSKNIRLRILACDISEKALQIAQKNIDKYEVSDIVQTKKSNLLESVVGEDATFLENCFIITNLPYIPESDAKIMSAEVLGGDPHVALFSGKTGTDVYKKLFTDLFQQHSNFYAINSCFFEFDSGVISSSNPEGLNYQKDYYEQLLSSLLSVDSKKITSKKMIDFFADYSGEERFGKIVL